MPFDKCKLFLFFSTYSVWLLDSMPRQSIESQLLHLIYLII